MRKELYCKVCNFSIALQHENKISTNFRVTSTTIDLDEKKINIKCKKCSNINKITLTNDGFKQEIDKEKNRRLLNY